MHPNMRVSCGISGKTKCGREFNLMYLADNGE
jgi:hypothetical protein